jgi:pyrroline-5-carboxylate reductase
MATLAVAGFGKLGSALVRGALRQGVVEPEQVATWARSEARCAEARSLGLALVPWPEVMRAAPVVLLALKPQAFGEMTATAPRPDAGAVLLSVMGGWSARAIGARLGTELVARAMPTVAAAVGASVTALHLPPGLPPGPSTFIRRFLEAAGRVIDLPEPAMDAATALGASGVGFACAFLESMERAGRGTGLDAASASALALGALEGAVACVRGGVGGPDAVRAQVTSPQGTTAAGLAQLQAGGLDELVSRAVRAAHERARELGSAAGG